MCITPKKQLHHELKTKLTVKKLYQTGSVKQLGIHWDNYLTWKHQMSNVASKLNEGNALLSKIRHYVDTKYLNVNSVVLQRITAQTDFACIQTIYYL